MTERVDVAIGGLLVASAVAIAIGREFDEDEPDRPLPTSTTNFPTQARD